MSYFSKRKKEVHPLEKRYRKAKSALMHRIYQLPFKERKPYEIEASYLFKAVEDYGFRGNPYLTVLTAIEDIETLLR